MKRRNSSMYLLDILDLHTTAGSSKIHLCSKSYPTTVEVRWISFLMASKILIYCSVLDFYILGDSAYPCNRYIITPYRDNGHLSGAKKRFNIKLSSARVTIEHTFGILKQRFRQLYYCKLRGIEKLCHFIRACCVLHNLANEDDFDFDTNINVEPDDDVFNQGTMSNYSLRDYLCQQLEEDQRRD